MNYKELIMSTFDINGGNPIPPAKVKVDLSQTSDLTCSNCGSMFFHTVYMFKKI